MKAFLITFLIALGDILIFYAALLPALWLRRPELLTISYFLQHVHAFSFVFPLWFLVNSVLGLYDFHEIREFPALLGNSLLAFFYSLLLSVLIFYLFPIQLMTPKTNLFLALAFTYTIGMVWRRVCVRMVSSGFLVQRMVFLGENTLIRTMAEDIQTRQRSRFRIIPLYRFIRWWLKGKVAGQPFPHSLFKNRLDLVVVDPAQLESDPAFRDAVMSTAIAQDIPLWTHLDFYERLYKKVPSEHAAEPAWLFSHVLHRRAEVYFWFKRLADVLGAATLIVILSPLLLILALLCKLLDGGECLYSQQRLGYLSKEFRFWKFRTMVTGAEKHGYLWDVSKNDPRVTPLGKFMRRYRLDELPQLWNILKGEMSFVGPRPTWTGETQALGLPNYHIRHLVKPGLTGWAQINYRSTDSLEDIVEKLHYDLYYVKHISLDLDLAILLKTVKRVLQPEVSFQRPAITTPRARLARRLAAAPEPLAPSSK